MGSGWVRMGGVESIQSFPEENPTAMIHRNAPLTPQKGLRLVQRVLAGRPVAHVAAEMGVSRATAHKWLARYRAGGRWRAHGRGTAKAKASKRGPGRRVGYTYVHTAIDGYRRVLAPGLHPGA